MTGTTTTDPAPERATPPPGRLRGPRFVAAAAALVLVAATAATIAVLARDDSDAGDSARPPAGTTPSLSGSCVELYSLTTLAHRELALDGTVARVDGDRVTLTVRRWFKGGTGDEVTLTGAAALGGLTSAGAGLSLEPGTRLLVAGDGGFAWACGFTQPYDAAVAEQWADLFG
jgi:hypothetical protein